jgi:hypothetical protein
MASPYAIGTARNPAASAGPDPEAIVKHATMRLLNEDAHFRAAVLEAKPASTFTRGL